MNTKNIILIKHSPSVQLGHLYEHLFVRSVNELLYKHGLFKSIDYSLEGTTFENGIIRVSYEAYNNHSAKFLELIQNTRIDLGENNSRIMTALFQMLAEENQQIGTSDIAAVTSELEKLDEANWENIDTITFLNANEFKNKKGVVYLSDQQADELQEVSVFIKINPESALKAELTPLFVFLSRILLFTMGTQLSHEFGFYFTDLKTSQGGSKVEASLTATHEPHRIEFNETAIIETANNTITYMLENDLLNRVVDDLQKISYLNNSSMAPNESRFIEDTGFVIGSKGWKEIATLENLRAITNSLSIECKISN